MYNLVEYFKYFKEANTPKLKLQAEQAAKQYCLDKYGVAWDGRYHEDFMTYLNKYVASYCDSYAKHKMKID